MGKVIAGLIGFMAFGPAGLLFGLVLGRLTFVIHAVHGGKTIVGVDVYPHPKIVYHGTITLTHIPTLTDKPSERPTHADPSM